MAEEQEPRLSFGAFILSLATTAAVHFGDIEEPGSGTRHPPNLAAASQMIDILAMLHEKTKGNLDPDERELLDQLLYELRMRFVEARKSGDKKIIIP